MGGILDTINTPDDVKAVEAARLPVLAEEVRETILETVSATGGHLASNLGAVELTIALLRVFCPPRDKIIWDVGHQTYTWKLLTGRRDRFSTLRQRGGLSGFPKPEESPFDVFAAGHAGTALSAALGMAVARDRMGKEGQVLAVIGDGSMTNGITLEALNSLADVNSKLIVILNDNEMSISGNVGALSRRLGRMLADVRYNRIKSAAEAAGHRLHMTFLRSFYHRVEQAVKSLWLQNAFFEEFGLRYVGPIDGHDFDALENALCSARDYKRPVLIHVATQKGRGFRPAERNPVRWHGVGAFDIGAKCAPASRRGYSSAFGEALTTLADNDNSIMAITAAMCAGTGLEPFEAKYPERFFDVGICESHAVVFAAGLAAAGFRPVFAVYSTFLQRAVDPVMHDVCLQNLPVLFCVDRAGVVGSDGPTHHGIYDIPMLRCLPNLMIMQPKDALELVAMIKTALLHDGPAAIRYPRDPGPAVDFSMDVAPLHVGKAEIVTEPPDGSGAGPLVWFWALGDMLTLAADTAGCLAADGVRVGIVNARFIKPVDAVKLKKQASQAALIVTIENGALAGGFCSAVRETLAACGERCQVVSYGWADTFVGQGTTDQLLADAGLTPAKMAGDILRLLQTS
ncbi:MAG: 1-deoxy-D-xylulose-5-phosphate synthase [Kiritimatiellae bacterium]|nr:1-deoxy-D-xylulose-5-phosphate synthase [Kiritimatiellia bacterium]MDD3543970.1 1-deoxy-D-xylulose-5-phosphate synthase [Kiritimatiellia bacterium]